MIEIAILLAAFGITLLEMSEASAVGVALYAETRTAEPFYAVSLGVITVLVPTAFIGNYIALLPIFYVRLVSATLLLYFGLRLMRSAKRSMRYQRLGFPTKKEEKEHGILITAYSVGVVEAFEAAIVLVALFPQNYYYTLTGLILGLIAVVIAVYVLRSQVRKVKQADVKVAVSAILLSFATFWYIEAVRQISDLFILLFFAIFFGIVYYYATYNIPKKKITAR
ncbi:MAG: hypothetical protein LVQ96_02785 [Thermoplasmatales archaeon]|nr:hypothetical protein [Thermoplasmatales archaeon]MCW6170076.1 hypothetical protein [Thermoplasmatales archaeon]